METNAGILQSSLAIESKIKTHTPLTQQHKPQENSHIGGPDDDPHPSRFWQQRINIG